MARTSSLLALLTAATGVSAGLAQARRALWRRQSSGSAPNQVQNWANNYATVDFELLSGGAFSVDWANGPGGDFVVGRGYQPARDMSVLKHSSPRILLTITGRSIILALSRPAEMPTSPSTDGQTTRL
jgi:hypothetical protein